MWAALAAQASREARAAREAWETREAQEAWEARAAWEAWTARDARVALTGYVAAKRGWTTQRPDLLTIGLRDAYEHGLGIALPTEPGVLGWAMDRSTRGS
mgnify:CR=1 FL=1